MGSTLLQRKRVEFQPMVGDASFSESIHSRPTIRPKSQIPYLILSNEPRTIDADDSRE